MEEYRALIRNNIQYPLLAAQNPEDTDLLDEIVELMTETVLRPAQDHPRLRLRLPGRGGQVRGCSSWTPSTSALC